MTFLFSVTIFFFVTNLSPGFGGDT